jgi:dihydrofolate reductase/thymidylate synthase
MFTTVVARDCKNGISKSGKIPWYIKEDLKWFASLTLNHTIIMGRKTYESIGKPLPNRENIIISHVGSSISSQGEKNTKVMTFEECLTYCNTLYTKDKKTIFVIGGGEIYNLFLKHNLISTQYITQLIDDYECDNYYNDIITHYVETFICVVGCATVVKRITVNVEECMHLDVMRNLLTNGIDSNDRTSTGTLSNFGVQLTYSLSNGRFPLMTTRKMFLRGIFEELMLFIRGQTNNQILVNKGINVWTANTTREQLDKHNLSNLPVGDMGHSYGFSFRHFGGKYVDCHTDYTGVGFDQINWLINEIKTNPNSRRLRISLWEPNAMNMAALPPCLEQYQFYVRNNELSCMMTQRSSDFAIASGWNVATGALLTYLIANVCNLQPKTLIWNIGDVHLYKNCIEGINEQITRKPNIYPMLNIINAPSKIEDFTFDNIQLINYQPMQSISFKMSV